MEPIKISRDGVYKLIKNINPSKATGPDTIAGRVLKENIDICTDILRKSALDKNCYVAAILMDLLKAFDCLPHDILLSILAAYGLSSQSVKV
jgi:hypothetical protein